MSDNIKSFNEQSSREIILSRVLDAPRERVFEAWVNPEMVVKWRGPNGFTTTTKTFEAAPGGIWQFVMHGPDGVDYKNRIVFEEIKRPELIKYTHYGEDENNDVIFSSVITFEDTKGKTKLTMISIFQTAEMKKRVVDEFKADEGASQMLDRLAEYLKKLAS
jgi:uncharacterized protein YndB with AHSA1/START domain